MQLGVRCSVPGARLAQRGVRCSVEKGGVRFTGELVRCNLGIPPGRSLRFAERRSLLVTVFMESITGQVPGVGCYARCQLSRTPTVVRPEGIR